MQGFYKNSFVFTKQANETPNNQTTGMLQAKHEE